ncbi:hypothetical protein J437_LFUL012295 [Ladona fulva]|uniref:Uncharacterized protein n=1 Tax=Ladona fulva TaxID=123851 RepID=A0A8K0P4K4_LADFU|nr:hypothetical protein J437_LFUL012295 [Ladona fulva]
MEDLKCKYKILLICLLAVSPSLGTYSAPTPIPFHASPIFQRPQETKTGNPVVFLPFFTPQQQKSQKPLYSGFVPIGAFPTPPAESAPIPWAQTQSIPRSDSSQGSYKKPIPVRKDDQPLPNIKIVKGATSPYPKKWIPITHDGKKIKPKNVEKRRKQLIVASSMTSKDISGQDIADNNKYPLPDKSKRAQIERLAEVYEPSPSVDTPSHPVPAQSEIPVEEVAFTEPRPNHRPYAYNHKQQASGSGFAPIFAAEAAAAQHGAASGFAGEGLHQISDGSGDRVLFHIHGEKGPNSYRFGYDTGKGPDRQFRYEERDDDGNVKGHFGYYDKKGKIQVVHYSADPKNGFSANSGNFGKHEVL